MNYNKKFEMQWEANTLDLKLVERNWVIWFYLRLGRTDYVSFFNDSIIYQRKHLMIYDKHDNPLY